RRVRDVGEPDADPAAECLDAVAAAGRLDLRRPEARIAPAEVLGDDRRERIDGGRAYDADGVSPGLRVTGARYRNTERRDQRADEAALQALPSVVPHDSSSG